MRTDLQGQGLGWALLAPLRDYAAADGLKCIEGIMLSENSKMLCMCRDLGVSIRQQPSGPRLQVASLDLNSSSATAELRLARYRMSP